MNDNEQEPLWLSIVFVKDTDLLVEKMISSAVHSTLRVNSETYFFLDMSNQYRKPQKTMLPKCSIKTIDDEEDFDLIIEKCKKEGIPYGVERKYSKKNAGSVVCLTIGPGEKSKINKVTRKLRNLKI